MCSVLQQYRVAEAAYAEVGVRLADGWGYTRELTVSDHDQEMITDFTPADLSACRSLLARLVTAH